LGENVSACPFLKFIKKTKDLYIQRYYLISRDIMDLSQYEIEIKRHAFIRAMQRGVAPDMIEATLKGGKIKRFGKNNLKFYKEYKKFKVFCIGQIIGDKIKIITIQIKR